MSRILGMGNALVDIIAMINSDKTLENLSLPKGSMQLVDAKKSLEILKSLSNYEKQIVSGGCAANTIYGMAKLGADCGFVGKIGPDEHGALYKKDLDSNNIRTVLLQSDIETGTATTLISPDSERTFATYLGAAIELEPDDITDELFVGYNYFHIEGYLVSNKKLIEKTLICAKKAGLIISLDLASYNVVEENLDFLTDISEKYVDILFANEEEAKSFTGKTDMEALSDMAKLCNIAVLKLGKQGSIIKHGDNIFEIKAIDANPIDTTGAGDAYAAGFLYGLANLLPLNKCGDIGSLLAGKVIDFIGARIKSEHWDEIKCEIKKIEDSI